MTPSDPTLNDVFGMEETSPGASLAERLDASEAFAAVRDRVGEEIDATEVSTANRVEILAAVGHDVLKKLVELLDVGILDIAFKVWNESGILKRYLDEDNYDPHETFIVPIGEHTIESVHRPFVELLVNQKSVGKVAFDVSVAIALAGVVLTIQDAKVKEIKSGTCSGSGSVRYGDLVLLEAKSREIPIPGSIDLGEGVPIAL